MVHTRMIGALLRLGAVVLLALLATSCASTNPAAENEAAATSAYVHEEYRIGIDDRVQVSVWRNPDLSVTVPVRPDGKISVPLIGDVQAGGRTADELAATISAKLGNLIREPHVTIILTELRSHEFLTRIRVTGAVHTPRSMPFRQGMTVLDAVLEAGGLNDFASPNRTRLYRKRKEDVEVFKIELGDIMNRGQLETNMTLLPGDVITVPERIF